MMPMIDFISVPRERMKKFAEFKKRMEELTGAKIGAEENAIKIESKDSVEVLCYSKVVQAFGRGFDVEDAILLLDD